MGGGQKSVIPLLEELEKREMLASSILGSAEDALRNSVDQFGNDMATAQYTLANMLQPSQTNNTSPSAEGQQLYGMANRLLADEIRMEQALVNYQIAVVVTEFQTLETWLADASGFLSNLMRSLSPPAADNGSTASGQSNGNTPSSTAPIPTFQTTTHNDSGRDPLYVLDLNTGETVPANATLNTFSTWREDLLAQVSGGVVSSYSWDLSKASDFTNASGQNTANLQGTWANFTGSAHTDTISVTETPQVGQPTTQTITFVVAGTDSPAYSSSRPISSSTWPTVITPDQLSSGQSTQTAGRYASIGLTDGGVQTSFAMPSYNSGGAPPSMGDSPT